MSLFAELKRRNVFRVATVYAAVSWLVIQVIETLLPIFGSNETAARVVVVVLAIGFIPVLIFAWVFEFTAEGLKREGEVDHDSASSRSSAKTLDRVIIAVLAVAVVYFAFDKFILDPARDKDVLAEATQQARDDALVSSYGEHSIAVMPFSDLSAAKDQEYFSDGIAEEIINLLSRIRNLRVIARSSAFSFKGQNLAASVIAERLNVRYIMEGSIRRAGERLRITTTVIDASTDTKLWSENFDRDFGDIFAIQDEIAGEVVDRLEMQISGRLPSADRVDPESYALYLQARHLSGQLSKDATIEADRLLTRSLEIDPSNIAARLFVERIERQKNYWGISTQEEAIANSREAIEKVLELEPANADGLIKERLLDQKSLDTWEGELDGATYALMLLPTGVEANSMAAAELSALFDFERSMVYSKYVLGKDPMCTGCLRTYFTTLMIVGDYERAIDVGERYAVLTGGSGRYTLGFIELLRGNPEKALERIEASETIPFVIAQGRAIVHWTLGNTQDYETALAELEASLLDEQYENYRVRPEDFLAGAYAWVGRESDALDILEKLIDPPRSWGPMHWQVDPIFRNLHEEPRWLALLEKEEISEDHIESYQLDKRFPGPGKVPIYEVPDI